MATIIIAIILLMIVLNHKSTKFPKFRTFKIPHWIQIDHTRSWKSIFFDARPWLKWLLIKTYQLLFLLGAFILMITCELLSYCFQKAKKGVF